MYTHIHTYAYITTCLYVGMQACMYVNVYVSVYMYLCVYVYVHMHVCVCVCVCMYLCVYVYIYICMNYVGRYLGLRVWSIHARTGFASSSCSSHGSTQHHLPTHLPNLPT